MVVPMVKGTVIFLAAIACALLALIGIGVPVVIRNKITR